jgi:8-oxo-dGTP pyrophosphatase MutT (NUDIX family)
MSGGGVRLQLHRFALKVFGALPRRVRRALVRLGSPKYTVGAICVVRRDDGAILLVRHSYYRLWGTPGGLAKRHERPELAAVRETMEEVTLRVELVGEPVVVVEPVPHRVDVVFLARPATGEDPLAAAPSSPEIERAEWFTLDQLPQLQVETVTALRALERSGLLDLAGADLRPGAR